MLLATETDRTASLSLLIIQSAEQKLLPSLVYDGLYFAGEGSFIESLLLISRVVIGKQFTSKVTI